MNELDLKDELRNMFNLLTTGNNTYKLLLTKDGYDAYYIVDNELRGVGVEIDEKHQDFKYNFENITIRVEERQDSNNSTKFFIELLSDKIYDTEEFFYICLKFIDPGELGMNRALLVENPQEWVNRWKVLFGNRSGEEIIYPLLGELISLRDLLKKGKDAHLTNYGSHDIETSSENYEVKTTTMRYDALVEIHSKNQLASLNGNPLYLYFVRLEESVAGVSLNSILEELKELKYDTSDLEAKFKKLNSESLEQNYKIDEIRLYTVDDKFPKIVDESFAEKQMPEGIYALSYTVDLVNLEYELIESNMN